MGMLGSDMGGMEFPFEFLTAQDDPFESRPTSRPVESVRRLAHLLLGKVHPVFVGRKERSSVGIVESVDTRSRIPMQTGSRSS